MSPSEAANVVDEYITSKNLRFERQAVGDRIVFSGKYAQLCSNFDFVPVRIFLEEQSVQTFVYFPIRIPNERLSAVADYFSRVNFMLKFGRFELDFRDGEARFQFAQVLGALNGPEAQQALAVQLDAPLFAFNAYGDGVVRIVKNDESPAVVVDECVRRSLERP